MPEKTAEITKPKRPTSPARAAASRANGLKTRGPVTARGKYNSSQNATRHGFLAQHLVLPGELASLFQQQYNDFMDEYQPRTPTERALVEEMVTSWWRKQRIWALESARIRYQTELTRNMGRALPFASDAENYAVVIGELADKDRSLDLFLRYETRYERQFHRALARLLDLQSRDPQPDDLPGDQAPPETTNLPNDPETVVKTNDQSPQAPAHPEPQPAAKRPEIPARTQAPPPAAFRTPEFHGKEVKKMAA